MRIAVTGGIAEGKSTVVGYLADQGVSTDSADKFAREVFVRPDIQLRLAALLKTDPPVSRDRLREAITDPAIRKKVNQILHPEILNSIRESEALAIEVPLLIEACLQNYFDEIWVVTCGPEEQLRRLAQRLGNEDSARRQIAMQAPTKAKLAFADEIIRTNAESDYVKRYVLEVWLRKKG